MRQNPVWPSYYETGCGPDISVISDLEGRRRSNRGREWTLPDIRPQRHAQERQRCRKNEWRRQRLGS